MSSMERVPRHDGHVQIEMISWRRHEDVQEARRRAHPHDIEAQPRDGIIHKAVFGLVDERPGRARVGELSTIIEVGPPVLFFTSVSPPVRVRVLRAHDAAHGRVPKGAERFDHVLGKCFRVRRRMISFQT